MGSDTYDVETTFAHESPPAGTPVAVVFYDDGRACTISADVESTEPLTLCTTDPNGELLKEARRVMLVVQAGKTLYKAEADVLTCEKDPALGWKIEAGSVLWQLVDRRRYPRYALKVPVILRLVHEQEGRAQIVEYSGSTDDLSLGGAWVTIEDEIPVGTLLEFQATLSQTEWVRALAVVAHYSDQRKGIGIEFLDYVGGARYNLHNYLTKAA